VNCNLLWNSAKYSQIELRTHNDSAGGIETQIRRQSAQSPPLKLLNSSKPIIMCHLNNEIAFQLSARTVAFKKHHSISLIKGACGQWHVMNKNAVVLAACYVILLFIEHKMLF
jgi:hypothetical protein